MPDGMEYPSKETDRKLQEIVGLTKSQFMQVAMIAQGEFMDLLRAKSDDKKVIFRKLFNTEMYQDIVAELGNRKRAKEKEIAVLKTQCQGEVSRIRIPETYESETLKHLKKQAQDIASKDFSTEIETKGPLEFQELDQAFNDMSHKLQATFQSLDESE